VHPYWPDVHTGDLEPVEGRYANYFEIRFTETEFLIDFGQYYVETPQPIQKWRVIVTPEAAHTLSRMLTEAIAKYEAGPRRRDS
jgi:hypothetical protein